jgi:hypothetical protein
MKASRTARVRMERVTIISRHQEQQYKGIKNSQDRMI